jgi:hypothetical protein
MKRKMIQDGVYEYGVLVQQYYKWLEKNNRTHSPYDVIAFIDDIERLRHESEPQNKWIPVKERLPDYDDKWGISKIVLCLDARGRVGFGIYQNGEKQLYHAGWFTGGGVGEDSVTVTHWMPLPEPPKGE